MNEAQTRIAPSRRSIPRPVLLLTAGHCSPTTGFPAFLTTGHCSRVAVPGRSFRFTFPDPRSTVHESRLPCSFAPSPHRSLGPIACSDRSRRVPAFLTTDHSSPTTIFPAFLTPNHDPLTTGLRAFLTTDHCSPTTKFPAVPTTNHYPLTTVFTHPPVLCTHPLTPASPVPAFLIPDPGSLTPVFTPPPHTFRTPPPMPFCETVKLWSLLNQQLASTVSQFHSLTVLFFRSSSQFCFCRS